MSVAQYCTMTNVHILQFWFWEKRRLDRLDRTIDYSKRDRPLVQYWDELKVRKGCAIFDKHGLEAGEVHKLLIVQHLYLFFHIYFHYKIGTNFINLFQTVHDLKEPWEVPRSPTPELFDELPPTDSKVICYSSVLYFFVLHRVNNFLINMPVAVAGDEAS